LDRLGDLLYEVVADRPTVVASLETEARIPRMVRATVTAAQTFMAALGQVPVEAARGLLDDASGRSAGTAETLRSAVYRTA
jgi:hypothetical protein